MMLKEKIELILFVLWCGFMIKEAYLSATWPKWIDK